jgi:hypothetical protein
MALRIHPESGSQHCVAVSACPASMVGPAAHSAAQPSTMPHAQALIAAADYLNIGRQRGCPDPLFDNLLCGVIDTIIAVAADLQTGAAS